MENTKDLKNQHSNDSSSVDSDENRLSTLSSSSSTSSNSSSKSSRENLENNIPCNNHDDYSSDHSIEKEASDKISEKDVSE